MKDITIIGWVSAFYIPHMIQKRKGGQNSKCLFGHGAIAKILASHLGAPLSAPLLSNNCSGRDHGTIQMLKLYGTQEGECIE
jgi:hypothetical protein